MTILSSTHPRTVEAELDDLQSVMGQQEALCVRLLEISTSERELLADGRVGELETLSCDKVALIEKMERLEAQRGATARAISARMGLSEIAPLRELVASISGHQRKDLEDTRDRIVTHVAALRDSNDRNLQLMRKALDGVRDSMRNLRRLAGTGEVYDSDGHSRWNSTGMLAVDRRA